MSSLTKKLLFFGVFSIVCNFTTSDINECKASVYEVFFEGMKPGQYFKHAMFALSEDLINSMNSTEEYVKYYSDNISTLLPIKHTGFETKLLETNIYFGLLHKPHSLSAAQYEISPVTKKNYILGYFRALVSRFKRTGGLLNSYVMSPDQFCNQRKGDPMCRKALYMMFGLNESGSKQKMMRLRKIKGHDAFMYCYKKYNYNDLIMAKFFPESSPTVLENQVLLSVMNAYLCVLTEAAAKIANANKESIKPLFPTIEEYCSGGSSSST